MLAFILGIGMPLITTFAPITGWPSSLPTTVPLTVTDCACVHATKAKNANSIKKSSLLFMCDILV